MSNQKPSSDRERAIRGESRVQRSASSRDVGDGGGNVRRRDGEDDSVARSRVLVILAFFSSLAQMSFEEFQQSIGRDAAPPSDLGMALKALWHDARGDWESAHNSAQDDHSGDGSWVHAYLHRKEGDRGNAGYWYSRAGRTMPASAVTLEDEWAAITRDLLSSGR